MNKKLKLLLIDQALKIANRYSDERPYLCRLFEEGWCKECPVYQIVGHDDLRKSCYSLSDAHYE